MHLTASRSTYAIVHRPDLPLLPGAGPAIGLGLWDHRPIAALLELAIVLAGSALYLRSAPRNRAGRAASAAVLISGLFTLGLNVLGF
jgi:hypothetical protein